MIAGFDSTHPYFPHAEAALAQVLRDGRLVAHTLAETFAVLSAPAGPYPARAEDVLAYLEPLLTRPVVGVAAADYPRAVTELASRGVVGGAVYDGLIGLAARDHDAQLISLDIRAAATYARIGVRYRLLGAA